MTTAYSIRDLAQEFGVTTRTLRFYEEKGLLNPSRNKQTRSYSNADRTRLRLILRGKRLGLSLEESSDIILMYKSMSGNQQQVERLLDKIREKRQQLLHQQEDLKLMLADLQDSEARCLAALPIKSNNIKY
jgi:DNA-binding transcriptional MerR regulator